MYCSSTFCVISFSAILPPEKIVKETKNFALRSNSATNFYSNGEATKKGQSILSKGTDNKQKEVQNNVSQNKKPETKVAKTETVQETPESKTLTTDNNTFVENNTASGFSNQNDEKTPKEKFNHYKGNTEINGANLKTEFELGKWRAEAYSNNPETKLKAEEMKQNFQKKITDKYLKRMTHVSLKKSYKILKNKACIFILCIKQKDQMSLYLSHLYTS